MRHTFPGMREHVHLREPDWFDLDPTSVQDVGLRTTQARLPPSCLQLEATHASEGNHDEIPKGSSSAAL